MTSSPEVEAHRFSACDQRIKTAITQAEAALSALRELQASRDEEAEVEGHRTYGSDARLKQAIVQTEAALEALRQLQGAPQEGEVDGHGFRAR